MSKEKKTDEVKEVRGVVEEGGDTPVYINTGDVDFDGLCSDLEHSDAEIEEQQYKFLKDCSLGKKEAKKAHRH